MNANDSPSRSPWDVLPLGLALATVALYLGSELYLFSGRLGWPLDDTWIHLHFARRLAAGDGLAYNPGHWVGGSTAPLWTALLSLGYLLPGTALVWTKLLGVGLFLVTVDATRRLAAELGLEPRLARLAAALVALTPFLVWSAVSGMEVLLFTALSLWGVLLHLRELDQPARLPASLPILALAALARPEGYFLVVAALADRMLARCVRKDPAVPWRPLLVALAAAAAVAGPTLLLYRVLGGSFLPSTFAVKAGPGVDLALAGRYLEAVIEIFFRSLPWMLVFAGAGALRLLERLGTARDRGLLLILWTFGLPLVSAILTARSRMVMVGNFGRYLFPLLPCVVLLGMLGWERIGRRLGRPGFAALVLVLAVPQVPGLFRGTVIYTQAIANVEDSNIAAAHWLSERLPPDAVIAAQDIGALAYYMENPIVDLVGIVNPDILPVLRGDDPFAWQERLYHYLAEREVAYLVIFPQYYPELVQAPGFRRVRSFQIRDNVTMAGTEVVIFSTPWTGPHTLREPSEER